ncbi:MAG: hypothetical protein M3Y76_11860 [Chloroflexota bacterium]|nr:hypothetical protein [Chloroflexota bacterium]
MSGRVGLSGEQDARATIKVSTHRATPPPPLQMSRLLRWIDKKPTPESGRGVVDGGGRLRRPRPVQV